MEKRFYGPSNSISASRCFLVVALIQCLMIESTLGEGEALAPPFFNLAQGRRIQASYTCGKDDYGNSQEELYCKLVGASSDSGQVQNLVQGQFCDVCDDGRPDKKHPAEYAIDGSERWWQSPPLSRSMSMNEVNVTIDLGQEFHVAYVSVTMANSPRPGVWVLERSADNGATYKPWQYFADTTSDCESTFGRESLLPITRDDSVICETQYSKLVPLEGGEIFVRLMDHRPSRSDFFSSDVLQEFTRATHVRLRLLQTKTLLGHLMSVARQDSTVTRRYFYSIKDISIGGRCRCNGHADLCDNPNPRDEYKLVCVCQHNTCGETCEYCCPGSVQRQWKAATYTAPFVCEACNCNGHSKECYYDVNVDKNRTSIDMDGNYKGGGVCTNCQHNTEGINCDECTDGFFKPYDKYWNETDACQRCRCDPYLQTGNCDEGSGRCECRPQFKPPNCDSCNFGYYDHPTCKPCDCNFNGTVREICEVGGGQCPCKPNFTGKHCDSCAENYYNFPECLPCNCNPEGSMDTTCDPDDGQCDCGNKFGGRQCDACERGYFSYPNCKYCDCDARGTEKDICDKTSGKCICREGYGGVRCDQCMKGFYGYPECVSCNCSTVGSSAASTCDASGKCPCLLNFSGRSCDQCKAGYRTFPECIPCNCDTSGTMGVSCDDEGKCQCKPNFDELLCNKCKEGFYNFPDCEECNCDPAGVLESFGGCGNSPPGELCLCKERVQGRICNDCKPLYWNLQHYNPYGCQECNCHLPGVLGGVKDCEGKSGQCTCKPHVFSLKCEQCQNGFYNLMSTSLLGCDGCNCDVGGAVSNVCDKTTGDCLCRPRITGKGCSEPLSSHYYPTLHQFQHEAEDGFTRAGGQVRFDYNSTVFPDYSWRGYAVYSEIQPETNHDIYVDKSSLYRVVLRYVNPTDQTITGEISASPDNPSDIEQKTKVRFEPRTNFVTVSTNGGPSPFVLNPGRWRFTIKSDQYLLIDYFTLLPAAYYEGSILQKSITRPCSASAKTEDETTPCVELQYPAFDNFDSKLAANSHVSNNGDKIQPSKYYTDRKVLNTLDVKELVLLSPEQNSLHFDLNVAKSGRFVVVVEYFTPSGIDSDTKILIEGSSKKGKANGEATIYDCQYTTLCRAAVTNSNGEIEVFRFDNPANIVLKTSADSRNDVAIHSITAIPLSKWSMDHITPKAHCVTQDGSCIAASFNLPPDSIKVEAEAYNADRIVDNSTVPAGVVGSKTKLIVLDSNDRSIDISGKVLQSGYYKFLVHYYQPKHPEFVVDVVIQNGQHYVARLPISHCPSTAGCRSEVIQEDKNSRFYVDDDFLLTLQSPKDVWIDYVLAVPAPYDNQDEMAKFLQQTPLDETARFISECGQNHMYLAPDTEGFCKDAVFSLSADYNNGALHCQCDFAGSKGFECDVFGGQCDCKANIIGRRCERCRTGFFGFPDCKPCDCPSEAFCDAGSGECICPTNVIGAKCDTCAPRTFGFDSLVGCEDCACSEKGVRDRNNLQCDLRNGSCSCKENVVGRTCNSCLAGHWLFPDCRFCGCDLRGSTEQICNQETRECHCKQFVGGGYCDTCEPGTFNLEERNPNGCTKCFCFGKTTRCSSSILNIAQINVGRSDWSAVAINPKETDAQTNTISYDVEVENESADDSHFIPLYLPRTLPECNDTHTVYFQASLKGNFLASYGGLLSYSLTSNPKDTPDRLSFSAPDVIIEGKELPPSTKVIRLIHKTIDHLDGENTMRMNLQLFEENFLVASTTTGGLVSTTRDQLMIVLKGLNSIYIRATYWKQTREAKLATFSLEMGMEGDSNSITGRAQRVEHCNCPPNYIGLSCEECAIGYYRTTSGPFGGHCVPCNCHRHTDTCDPVSGICGECRDNTRGDHCESCDVGFHGDATQGTPYDCLICACPLPIASNNFATSCEFSRDGSKVSCECKENYFGLLCESCDSGYYGRPEVPGDYCKPCQCSGNIDVDDPSSCDTVTGACLRCMNNTGGPACNICKRDYFGDALITKDCEACSCDKCGTYDCDSYTGGCSCLPNVIGVNCNRCKPDHFGHSRCDQSGCHHCNCGIASHSTQCHDLSGQCDCKLGTTGRQCERCSPGYWNYTADGCQPCACNIEYAIGVGCDASTGQCSCLPGVEGINCERCPYRWVLVEDRGCQSCDSCQHQLLDETDRMAAILNPVKKDFDSVAVSYFTTQKMTYFNETAESLEADVRLLDPSKENLKPYYDIVNDLETSSKTYKQKAEATSESLKDKSKASLKLRVKAVEVESEVQEAVAKARTAVFETTDLLEGLMAEEKLTSPQTEAAMAEARATIDSMSVIRFNTTETEEEKKLTSKILDEVKEFVQPLTELGNELKKQSDGIVKVRAKLKDLRNESDYSMFTSLKTKDIITKIKDARYPTKIALLDGRAKEMKNNLDSAILHNEKIPAVVEKFDQTAKELGQVLSSVQELKEKQEQSTNTLINELGNNKDTILISQEHAKQLKRQADNLDRMFDDSKRASEKAFAAATAYQKIADALEEAEKMAMNAKRSAENATETINGLEQSASLATEPSRNLLTLSDESVSQVEDKLKIPLRDAKVLIDDINKTTEKTKNSLNNIAGELDKSDSAIPNTVDLSKSIEKSSEAIVKAQGTLESISNVAQKLPNDESAAKQLPITVTDLNKGVEVSDNQLKAARDSIPLSIAITESLQEKKPNFEQKKEQISNQLADLKARIASARELANRVAVGINFVDSSTLVASNPQSLDSQQVRTEMTFYFKTQEQSGLLLFLGNEPGRKGENDFVAIEIDGGYPGLTLDLGSGPQKFTINEKYVADDKWYKATVDRNGRRVRFSISEETNDGSPIEYATTDYYRLGTKSLLNIDRNSSKLFVGGFPPGQFRNPVRNSNYQGVIEDLTIGGQKVGLWNFKDAQHIQPAEGRDRFLNLRPERGLRFLGNGYAIMSAKHFRFVQSAAIRLSFRTRAQNGLLFLVGKGRKFMSLEIVNGSVVFQYNLGAGTGITTSPETYNDGKWHKIDAVRDKNNGLLKINNMERGYIRTLPSAENLAVSDHMYFGGYPGRHDYAEVTNKDFDGCIDIVMINENSVDLTEATDTRDTMVGCPASQVEQVATFYGDGFLKVPFGETPTEGPVVSQSNDDQFELNFRFRSNETNGLIFYGSDPTHENYLSVSLENGALHIIDNSGTKVKTQQLNDANWHVVTVSRSPTKLSVNVDDTYEQSKDAPGGPLMISKPGSSLLFGGHPADYAIPSHTSASTSSYQGCLADINVNGKRIDFSESESAGSSVSQKCLTGERQPESVISPTISSLEDGEEDIVRPAPTRKTTTASPKFPIEDDDFPDINFDEDTTTVRIPKALDEPTPTPFQQCALPYRTKLPLDDNVSLQKGIRFGNFEKESRLEFEEPRSDGSAAEYSIDFKTSSPDGLILMKNNNVSVDFIALYLLGGAVHFSFDPGSNQMALLNSSAGFSDGRWHSVTISHFYKDGELKIDGASVAKGSSGGQTRDVNAGTRLYVGGLSDEVWNANSRDREKSISKRLQNMNSPFKGCLRNLWSRNSGTTSMVPVVKHSVEPCTEASESGFNFYPNAGYMIIANNFRVLARLKINLKIKPRTPSGLILAVHGLKDYLVLQMINGTVKFTVDNGKGALSSSFTKEPYDLCDGQWHTIQVSKAKNVVTLAVDNTFALPGIGSAVTTWTDTNNPLYFGGHPSPYNKIGVETTEQFVGCIKDLVIEGNRTAISFNYNSIIGHVGLHSCPTD